MARILPSPVRPGKRTPGLEVVGGPAPAVELLGVAIDSLTQQDAIETVASYVEARTPRQVVTVNLDFLRLAHSNPDFGATLNGADLALADGMPLVWASSLAGEPLPERVAGVDLVEALCAHGGRSGWSVYLLGAAPGVADTAAAELTRRNPGLRIAGVYSPPVGSWDEVEDQRIRTTIRDSQPDLLLVALGAPKQDTWILENKDRLGVPVSIGVGCTFDVIAGDTKRAPRWMQRRGFEWLFRLISEPGRLWRRYILHDLPTFGRLFLGALRSRRRASSDASRVEGGQA